MFLSAKRWLESNGIDLSGLNLQDLPASYDDLLARKETLATDQFTVICLFTILCIIGSVLQALLNGFSFIHMHGDQSGRSHFTSIYFTGGQACRLASPLAYICNSTEYDGKGKIANIIQTYGKAICFSILELYGRKNMSHVTILLRFSQKYVINDIYAKNLELCCL